MYRLVVRYRGTGRECAPVAEGIEVERTFYLLGEKGKRLREVAPGEAVPVGAYLESVVRGRHLRGDAMSFVLVENPRPSGGEVVPEEDRRFDQSSTPYVLREEREAHVAYHHERTEATLIDHCVLHIENAGEFLVPPAVVEMMYQTETRGHSGTFRFRAVERAAR